MPAPGPDESEVEASLARLSRFYGGTPDYWRDEARERDVVRYLRMIPVLTAEESLLSASRIALGSGTMKRGDARALQRAWERQTGRAKRDRRRVADPSAMGALGIAVATQTSPTSERTS
jgi:hypothetical protein